ncbi:hypothetical protein [Brucella anthropi]|uniref:hypothetical protein n=1 Tax=Brucella anthropi TaxID=529 RepID=UPI000F66E500|nr:hypothetical protein [Brucella anthropi]
MADKNNPRWMNLLEKIADSWSDDDRSKADNIKDKSVHTNILRGLISGKPLSDKQAAAFVSSIRKRVPFMHGFSWTGQIFLTRRQVRYMRASGLYDRLSDKFSKEVQGLKEFDPKSFVTNLSPVSSPIAPDLPSVCPDDGAQSLENKGFPALTLLNETKQNSAGGLATSQDEDSFPSTDVGGKPQHLTSASMHSHVAHVSATPSGIGEEPNIDSSLKEISTIENTSAPVVNPASPQMPAAGPASNAAQFADNNIHAAIHHGFASTDIKIALWRTPGALTGTITIDSEVMQVDFRTFRHHEAAFFSAHCDPVDKDWYYRDYEPLLANDLRDYDRDRQLHDRPDWFQFALSPLYKERNSKVLAYRRFIVRCVWGDDLNGADPTGCILLWEKEELLIPIKPNNKSKNPKAPDYKN